MTRAELQRRERDFEAATAASGGNFDLSKEKRLYQADKQRYFDNLDAQRDHTGGCLAGRAGGTRTFDEGAAA